MGLGDNRLFRRLRDLVDPSARDRDMQQEMQFHLDSIANEYIKSGVSDDAARLAARRRFGNQLQIKDRGHDVRRAGMVEDVARELRHAARRLMRSPAFTLASALTLALAIGANAAIFAVVERVVLNPLPYPDSNRLVVLDHGLQRLNIPSGVGLTPGLYHHYSDRSKTLEGVAIYRTEDGTLTGGRDPERIRIARVTTGLSSVMRVSPALGRWFTEEEGVPGSSAVAVLAHGLWMRRYGGDRAIVGRTVRLEGVPTEVIGVMPATFAFPEPRIDVWTAEPMTRTTGFGIWSYNGVARLRDGATVEDARTDVNALIADIPRAFPTDPMALGNSNVGLISTMTTVKDQTIGNVARALWILLASVGVVLLVACANVANLFLVRSEARQREVAVRRALGAGRPGIARYFLAESLLLSVVGGVMGLAFAWGAVRLLVGFAPTSLPRLEEIRLDGFAVAFTFVLTILAGLVFGAIPLWRGGPLAATLHEGGRSNTASRGRHRLRHLLMAGQVALALVLLVSSALMVRSFQKLRAVDPGFDARSTLTFGIGLPVGAYPTRRAAVAAHHAIIEQLSALPGVTAVSGVTHLPFAGGGFGNTVRVEGRTYPPGTLPAISLFRAVAGGYFDAMGIRVLRGRAIDRGDVDRNEPIVVINQTFATRFFPNGDPIGQRVASNRAPRGSEKGSTFTWLTIVGIVADTPTNALAEPTPIPQMFMPMSIAGGPDIPTLALAGPDVSVLNYVVRSATPPLGLLPSVRRTIEGD